MTRTMPCPRCGIRREVNQSREVGLCFDCRLVERDLAAMHGTAAGYKRHWRAGELACDPCLKAHAEADTRNRRRADIGPRPKPVCGTEGGYSAHRRNRETACDDCKAAASAAVKRRYRARKDAA